MSEEKNLNIYQKLAKVRKVVEVLKKNKSGYGYKYTSIDEILAKVTGVMDKYDLSLIPKIVEGSAVVTPYSYEKTKILKDGRPFTEKVNEIITQANITYVWVNNDNPYETIPVPWFVVGSQSDPSQAFGSGLTYGLRQFLLQFFQISALDDSDPDAWRTKQAEAEAAEDAMVVTEIINQVHEKVTKYLEQNPDDRQSIVDLTKKYAKDSTGKATSNYKLVKDPQVASEVLKAINEYIEKEKK